MIVFFLCPSLEEEYRVSLGSVLNVNFLLGGGNFKTDIFSTVDMSAWLALQFFFFLVAGVEESLRGRKVSDWRGMS